MAGEKRFGTSFFGFNKIDVNTYIEKILKEFDDKLKEKDNEIASLKSHVRESKIKFEDLCRRSDQVNDDRGKIADVLIKAQEKAEVILEEARQQAIEEKKKLDEMVEKEKEKLVDIKADVKGLKSEVIKTLKKYEIQLNVLVEENDTKQSEDKKMESEIRGEQLSEAKYPAGIYGEQPSEAEQTSVFITSNEAR